MGEAKRRHLAMASKPCRCGSNKAGEDCCWTERGWHKAPANIDLVAGKHRGTQRRCYLRELNTCSETISGEHMISETVLRAIGKDQVIVSGLPWLEPGETRSVGIKNLVGNCLCDAHNSSLSPLDATAGKFYRALQDCFGTQVGPNLSYLFSGHDIERWLFKTLASSAASKNLSTERESLPGFFDSEISVCDLLQNPLAWRMPTGMYFTQGLGAKIHAADEFAMAPLFAETKEIGGVTTMIQGFAVTVVAVPSAVIKNSVLDGALFRPEKLHFKHGSVKHTIELSWIKRHS